MELNSKSLIDSPPDMNLDEDKGREYILSFMSNSWLPLAGWLFFEPTRPQFVLLSLIFLTQDFQQVFRPGSAETYFL